MIIVPIRLMVVSANPEPKTCGSAAMTIAAAIQTP